MKSTTMKKIEIEIPEGKEAKWVDGVLTLVDEKPKNITERIKTFEDALEALGDEHPLVKEYWGVVRVDLDITQDLYAYLKLRIIAEALNEGWEPKFDKGEYRYFPCFRLHTKEEYDKLDNEEKESHILRSNNCTSSYSGFVDINVGYDASSSYAFGGSRLALRTRELAEYAGRQFTEVWFAFVFELNSRIFIKQ